ncbi:hypothetical protein ACSSNL_09305 [Thalassobius sp. S69A]|uniref:hypothetical protein n=1 Tax=unclassified Thalassovita TaxID=2619711 RepID=UPI003C7DF7F1
MKVVYCAYGARKYADQLAQSVRSLRGHHPKAEVIVHTVADFAPLIAGLPVRLCIQPDRPRASDWHDPLMKLRAIRAEAEAGQPFLYLDNDTYVAGSLASAWGVLSRFDCLGVLSAIHDQRGFLGLEPAPGLTRPTPEAFPEWNGGVLFFAGTEAARRIARRWLEVQEMGIPGGGDQWPLAQALWDSQARLHVLPANYNCRLPASPVVYGAVKILHADHTDLAEVASRVNAETGLRQVVPQGADFGLRSLASDARCF